MEESKELQGFYKIFRAVIYISVLMEFFEYAIDPRTIDGFGGVVCDLHDRIKQWFIYHDGNLVYSKVVTFLLVCITCVGTRNKKHLEFDARRQVLYPLVSGVLLLVLSVWLFGYVMDTRLYALRLDIILYMVTTIIGTVLVHIALDSIWAKIAKYGGSTLKGVGSYAKQGLKSAGNATVHPAQALRSTGSAMKTAAVGSAAGYVAWQNLVNDKSMVEIASDVVVGKDTTEKISEAVEDVKGLKNKAGEAVDAVNGAMGDINSKWSGMSNFFRGIFGGNGLEMFGNFFKNLGKGNVSGLSLAGLVTAAFLTFGRFGWLGKIAGAMLGMMLIGNNSNIKNIVSGDGGQGRKVNEAETTVRSGGMKR